MKRLILLSIFCIAIAVNGFSYELSANPTGILKEQSWQPGVPGWTSAKRNIRINIDVYNLDATGTYYDAPQAFAKVKYYYTNNLGEYKNYQVYWDDRWPHFGGPGSVYPVENPGSGTPYASINKLEIGVYRATSAIRAMAWGRADLWW